MYFYVDAPSEVLYSRFIFWILFRRDQLACVLGLRCVGRLAIPLDTPGVLPILPVQLIVLDMCGYVVTQI